MTSAQRSRPSWIRPAALICAVTIATLLAACSTPAPAAPGAGGAGGAAPAAHPSSSASSKPTAAAAINVCALVPLDTVARASGLDLSSPTPDPSSVAAGLFGCSYDSADGSSIADLESELDVTVYVTGTFTIKTLKAALDASSSDDGPTVAVSGIGDEAYASAGGFAAKFGGHLIKVSGLSFDLLGNHSASQSVAAAFISAVGR